MQVKLAINGNGLNAVLEIEPLKQKSHPEVASNRSRILILPLIFWPSGPVSKELFSAKLS